MWSRAELKARAKTVLSKNYWSGFGAIMALYGLNFVISYAAYFIAFIPMILIISMTTLSHQTETQPFIMIPLIICIYIIIFCISIFLEIPLQAGLFKYFKEASYFNTKVSHIFYAFKKGNYLKIIGSMLWMSLFVFLWSLLFIIPGIIKGISYSMTPFILADNPKIGYRRALKLSQEMTRNQKGRIFVFYLSFIGWFLLGSLACGIGVLFVVPYYMAAAAELYNTLRIDVLLKGRCTFDELNIKIQNQTADNYPDARQESNVDRNEYREPTLDDNETETQEEQTPEADGAQANNLPEQNLNQPDENDNPYMKMLQNSGQLQNGIYSDGQTQKKKAKVRTIVLIVIGSIALAAMVITGIYFASRFIGNTVQKNINESKYEYYNQTGCKYLNGDGVEVDYNKAYQNFVISAKAGDDEDEYKVGFFYENGYGIQKNPAEAKKWYKKAGQDGNTYAADALKYLK